MSCYSVETRHPNGLTWPIFGCDNVPQKLLIIILGPEYQLFTFKFSSANFLAVKTGHEIWNGEVKKWTSIFLQI